MLRVKGLIGCADAPGKVILFGEHFVVEGVPAVATAVSLRARACCYEVEGSEGVFVYSNIFDKSLRIYPSPDSNVTNFYETIKYVHNTLGIDKHKNVLIRIDSSIPPAAGLGSSAATAVALAAAYALAHNVRLTPSQASQAAYAGEKVVHGKPSGIDNTIAAYGGTILYRKGEGFKRIPVNLEGYRLIIADTGVKRSTRRAVEAVLNRKKRLGRLGNMLYSLAAELVKEAVEALREGEADLVGELMDVNQGLLNALGVSTPRIEELVHTARLSGALGAKLTGAGLGGCIISLTRIGDAERIAETLRGRGAHVYIVKLNAEGLRYQTPR